MNTVKVFIAIILVGLFVVLLMRKNIEKFAGSTFVVQSFPIGDAYGWCGTAFPNKLFRVLMGIDIYGAIGQQFTPYYFCETRVPAGIDQKNPIDWMKTPKFCMPKFKASAMGSRYNAGKWAPNMGSFFYNLMKTGQRITTTYYGVLPPAVQSSAAALLNPVTFAANATTTGAGYANSSGAEDSANKMVDAISRTEGDSFSYFYRCDPV